jgi:SAM-dependent methyltransferase
MAAGVKNRILQTLREPAIRSVDPDSLEYSIAERAIFERKAILRRLFEDRYRRCLAVDARYFRDCPGRRLEIGSGIGMAKFSEPSIITSDIKPLPWLDLATDAEHLPFADRSLRAIYCMNMFHHILRPRAFFTEALRVLHPGGGLVIVDCYHGPMARYMLKGLHGGIDDFDPSVREWEAAGASGPFSGGNTALSWIVFSRDRARFEREFPELEILMDVPHTHVWFYASGGLSFRQLVPDGLTPLVKAAETLLSPFNRWLALFHTIVLRKAAVARP